MAYNWTCPFCNRDQSVTSLKFSQEQFAFQISETSKGPIGLRGTAICCSNPECLEVQIEVDVVTAHLSSDKVFLYQPTALFSKRIIPESKAKPQPNFIPASLREDYLEACKIRELSPKASATLSRRCLQGMIRDFCGVSGKTLYTEIENLRLLIAEGKAPIGVSFESVDAIHHVREIGNIGAHMEKDIDHIVPVEPEEAQILIGLIESLFEEWYVARENRALRFGAVKSLADSKRKLISDLKIAAIEGPTD